MKFTTGQVITAGLGKLCCTVPQAYAVLNFLTGDNLYTHQLPRAFHACREWVREQCPWLRILNETTCTKQTWRQWLAEAERLHGTEHDLQPLPSGQWRPCDPVREAVELMEDKERVVVVKGPR